MESSIVTGEKRKAVHFYDSFGDKTFMKRNPEYSVRVFVIFFLCFAMDLNNT